MGKGFDPTKEIKITLKHKQGERGEGAVHRVGQGGRWPASRRGLRARPEADLRGPAETVKLVVRVRNVGKDEVTFRYAKETFFRTPPP